MVVTLAELASRFAERASRFPSRRTERVLLAATLPLFLGAGVWAYLTAEISWGEIRPLPLLAAFLVGVPLTALVNGWEYSLSARLLDRRISLADAMRITVVSTALNYLPGHGGALFRVQSLHRTGPGYRETGAATLLMGLAWVGLAGLVGGGLLVASGAEPAGWAFLALGIAVIAAGGSILAAVHEDAGSRLEWAARIATVEAASILATAFRLYILMLAVDTSASATAAFVLTLAVVLSSATGLVPGGLGLRELLASLFAPMVGMSAAVGFLLIAVDRVLGLLGHAPVTVALLRRTTSPSVDTDGGEGTDCAVPNDPSARVTNGP